MFLTNSLQRWKLQNPRLQECNLQKFLLCVTIDPKLLDPKYAFEEVEEMEEESKKVTSLKKLLN